MRKITLPAFGAALVFVAAAHAGIDPKNVDRTVKPSDDFYRYVNGTWLISHVPLT